MHHLKLHSAIDLSRLIEGPSLVPQISSRRIGLLAFALTSPSGKFCCRSASIACPAVRYCCYGRLTAVDMPRLLAAMAYRLDSCQLKHCETDGTMRLMASQTPAAFGLLCAALPIMPFIFLNLMMSWMKVGVYRCPVEPKVSLPFSSSSAITAQQEQQQPSTACLLPAPKPSLIKTTLSTIRLDSLTT